MSASPRFSIGFIGLGVMGGPMARNIARAGFDVRAYDRSPEAMRRLSDAGCKLAASANEAAGDADILIAVLPTAHDVRSVLIRDDGAARAMRPGGLVIDMSTGDAAETDSLAAEIRALGLRHLDAPIGRTRREALVNNYMSMVGMVLTSEALMFASKLGLDRQTVVDVLSSTVAGRGQLLTNFPRKVLRGDVSPDFPLRMGFKDIDLALRLAATVGAPLGLGAYAREMYALAKSWGRTDEDCTAMLLLLEDIAHVPHSKPPTSPT